MLYRRLGRTGLQVSALSFGAWVTFGTSMGRGAARRLITQACDAGLRFFVNAETYDNLTPGTFGPEHTDTIVIASDFAEVTAAASPALPPPITATSKRRTSGFMKSLP